MMQQKVLAATRIEEGELFPSYHIDEAWYEQQGRSLRYMIESRTEGIEPAAVKAQEKPSKRKTKAIAVTKGVSMESLAKLEGFIRPELTILEAIFRLILVHQNKPLPATQISEELAEHGIGVMDSRVVRPGNLVRMLDADFHYGIRRFRAEG